MPTTASASADAAPDGVIDRHLAAIQADGYVRLGRLFSQAQLTWFTERLRELLPVVSPGHRFIYNLHTKDLGFLTAFTRQPLLMALLRRCLNDTWYRAIPQDQANFILRGLVARSSGEQPLALHLDSFVPATGDYLWNLIVSVAIDPSDRDNGCTLIVPGSHRFGRYATQDALAEAVPLESTAGEVVLWDSRLWHGAGANRSGRTRWAINATFSRWWIKQSFAIPESLPPADLARLTLEEQAILGRCTRPPRDEHDRIDIKGGYELLDPDHRSSSPTAAGAYP